MGIQMIVLTMYFLQFLLFSLICFVALNGCTAGDLLQLNDDVLGLIVLKSGLHDPLSSLNSWSEDDNSPCSWKFIRCNPANGRVVEVALDGLALSGKIGRGLVKLQYLKVLSLSRNNFSGNISPELALIGTLNKLNLSHNSFSGNIPTIVANTSSLRYLDLSGNSFSGSIDDNMFDTCPSLRFVSLAGNLLEGPLPSTLSMCTTLNHLNLSNNHFSGNPNFVSGIWSLSRIRNLDISDNGFSGPVPYGISAIHNLKELNLKGNDFSGSLPTDIGLCPHLNKLDFSDNLFTGEIPWSLQSLHSLTFLSLSNNLLSGDFPQWIGNMSSLEYIDFSGNSLMGVLPSTMGGLQSLKYLSLSDNKLNGGIPMSLHNSSKLSVIQLRGNAFNGSIPEDLFNLGLEKVDLSRNELSGFIPPGSRKLFENLHTLDLSENKLRGDVPAEMGLLSKLRYFNLSWNSLHSRITPELGYFQNLTALDLRNNDFYGQIPVDICDSGSLAILQLDGNSLTGSIPEKIGNCSSLYLLSLSHNNISGFIPRSLSMLNKLKILKLEFNQLSGEIPQDLGRLENVLAVNISYNRLTGRLPAGNIFQNLDQTAIQGNLGLCSPLLRGPCKMNVPKPLVLDPYAYGNQMGGHHQEDESPNTSTTNFGRHRFLSFSAIFAISAALLIVVGVVVITLLNVSARRRIAFVDNALESMFSSSSRSRSRSGSMNTGKLILFDSKASLKGISNPESLLNEATEIGEGMFGTVYKASLGGEGRTIAIKKLFTSNILQHPEDFDLEVRVLGKARHPNLISLNGYYWTPQLQLLVTDYAPNGSLQSKLHDKSSSLPPLSWPNRFKIMLGTAKGLAHLHHSFSPPIIHYNIKPTNILLDGNLNPKISDFGLARLLTELERHITNNRFHTAVGYVAPELACQSLRVNEKCDIYGFGMLILELVTCRRPVEYGEDDVLILHDHVRILLEQGNVLECVDPSMGDYPEEEVLPVLKLALVCTSQIPSSRPSMSEVVQILQVIKTPIPRRTVAI